MTAFPARSDLLTIEEYLAGEMSSPVKHEYVGGAIYAMAGGTNNHNAIATNALVSLGTQLRGKACRPFNSDTKVRIQLPTHTRLYYPDAMVVCHQNKRQADFQDSPAIILEVISESTRRIDEQEKLEAYLTISSLTAYVLLEQDRPKATIWRRAEQGFIQETVLGLESVIVLDAIGVQLPFADVYEAITFPEESTP